MKHVKPGVEKAWRSVTAPPRQRLLDELTVADAKRFLAEGHFLRGSMGPKVEACTRFVRWSGKMAWIGSLDRAAEILEGRSGTRFGP